MTVKTKHKKSTLTKASEKESQEFQNPAEILRGIFLDRKGRNQAYSTRAFARDLGISQSLLSMVMSGKRPLTVKQAAQISVLLGFSKEDADRFLESTLLALPENSKALKHLRKSRRNSPRGTLFEPIYKNYEIERFKALSQWYHVAILDLTTTHDFKEDSHWIARRLGISPIEATDAVSRLLTLGLLLRIKGKLVKSTHRIYFPTQRSEPAIRSFHQQMIGKAMDQLELVDDASFEARQISAMTMAIPKSAWPEAKARIQKFQQELATFLGQGDCDEIYQMNIQMFPLTQKVEN